MKEKIIRGQHVEYAESAREMRGMFASHSTQLLAQPGSAIAICQSDYDTLAQFAEKMPFVWCQERKEYLDKCNFKVLISHRSDNGKYSLVGGARKLCESFEETAYRELGEETGLELEDLLFLGMVSGGDEMVNIYPDGNAAEGLDALYMALVPKGSVVRANTETTEFLWLSVNEIQAKIEAGEWHPAQVKTMKLLLDSLVVLREMYQLKEKKTNYKW